jgi:hypothetical protein
MTMVIGQKGAPVEAALGVALHAADIDSLELTASLDTSGVGTTITVVLNEPSGPRTLVLDPAALDDKAVDVILQLLQARLAGAGVPPAIARLPELLGIGTSDPMPLAARAPKTSPGGSRV